MAKTQQPPVQRESKTQILERAEREKVKFLRLQFTDILGIVKNVEIPDRQFEDALDGKIMFDGSSIEGFVRVEESHNEVAPGQHEIDFRYDDVLTTADNISTFRFVVKNVAIKNGLHATFMPKPIYGINGSGMHTHMSLFANNVNMFYDAKAPW